MSVCKLLLPVSWGIYTYSWWGYFIIFLILVGFAILFIEVGIKEFGSLKQTVSIMTMILIYLGYDSSCNILFHCNGFPSAFHLKFSF